VGPPASPRHDGARANLTRNFSEMSESDCIRRAPRLPGGYRDRDRQTARRGVTVTPAPGHRDGHSLVSRRRGTAGDSDAATGTTGKPARALPSEAAARRRVTATGAGASSWHRRTVRHHDDVTSLHY
jgi:hypothetical protein